ncbi:hypothetical protein H632_c4637p0, partial [Helicosporidium sp. ATCC 50920]
AGDGRGGQGAHLAPGFGDLRRGASRQRGGRAGARPRGAAHAGAGSQHHGEHAPPVHHPLHGRLPRPGLHRDRVLRPRVALRPAAPGPRQRRRGARPGLGQAPGHGPGRGQGHGLLARAPPAHHPPRPQVAKLAGGQALAHKGHRLQPLAPGRHRVRRLVHGGQQPALARAGSHPPPGILKGLRRLRLWAHPLGDAHLGFALCHADALPDHPASGRARRAPSHTVRRRPPRSPRRDLSGHRRVRGPHPRLLGARPGAA